MERSQVAYAVKQQERQERMNKILVGIAIGCITATAVFGQTNGIGTNTIISTTPFQNVVTFIGQNGKILPAGIGVNLHGKVGESLAQQLDIVGGGSTNLWRIGVVATTVFQSSVNSEQLGVGGTYEVQKMPGFVKHFLLITPIPREVQFGVSVTEPLELYTKGTKGYDWKQTTANVNAGWKF